MARKEINKKLLLTGQSLGASFQSPVTNVDYQDTVVYIVETAGITDNTGTFQVQARIKVSDDPNQTSSWVDLTGLSFALADANVTDGLEIREVGYSETRVVFTPAGGTPNGTTKLWVEIKQVGG